MKVQVSKEHYNFSNYINLARWMSYYYQINFANDSRIDTILYVGAGNNIVVDILRKNGKNVDVMDFDEALKPDVIGSVDDIENIVEKEYDCIMCCQVLEHLPFEKFENIIRQFKKIAKKKVIISLPYRSKTLLRGSFWAPKIHDVKFIVSYPKHFKNWSREKDGGGEHYWEIGIRKECSKKSIRKIFSRYFDLECELNPMENRYHVFYVLKKK